jgi:predicted nucleic acid-binding protein
MTFAYLDTSAAVKRYVSEPGSLRVRALLRRHDFLSSAITPVEITSALCRRKQNGDLSEENFRTVLHRVQNDRRQWELVEVGTMVLTRAEEIIQGSVPVKALDAIHIASLVTFQAAARIRIPFITGDGKQRDAAGQMGLDTVWVG